ncbi:hypothetical protein EUGRSUZ_I00533 [Eucalyptus grandis]|uniref:Uncharacterized protein n=2 Tax=Eucalyptus grandis TaxID=71139 RepID=A0ACC3JBY1_EUCGR|nr:hypothetical protein EUGRSUZ_I00533 [Eucalyptus grandis]
MKPAMDVLRCQICARATSLLPHAYAPIVSAAHPLPRPDIGFGGCAHGRQDLESPLLVMWMSCCPWRTTRAAAAAAVQIYG